MAEELFQGILKPEEEKEYGKFLDEIIDFKEIFKKKAFIGLIAESIDGKLFTAAIVNLDDKLLDKMPSDYKPLAREFVLACLSKDWGKLIEVTPVLLNKKIDIPGLDEDTELALFVGLVETSYLAVLTIAKKKTKDE